MKIAFTRRFAIEMIGSMYEDDPEESPDFDEMSNEELESDLCLAGYIHDDHMGGVFDDIPEGMQDAEKNSAITGWPVEPI